MSALAPRKGGGLRWWWQGWVAVWQCVCVRVCLTRPPPQHCCCHISPPQAQTQLRIQCVAAMPGPEDNTSDCAPSPHLTATPIVLQAMSGPEDSVFSQAEKRAVAANQVRQSLAREGAEGCSSCVAAAWLLCASGRRPPCPPAHPSHAGIPAAAHDDECPLLVQLLCVRSARQGGARHL